LQNFHAGELNIKKLFNCLWVVGVCEQKHLKGAFCEWRSEVKQKLMPIEPVCNWRKFCYSLWNEHLISVQITSLGYRLLIFHQLFVSGLYSFISIQLSALNY